MIQLNRLMVLLLFAVTLQVTSSRAQVTMYVTDDILSNSAGSLDSVIYAASTSANAGNDVIVLFDAPGLVQVTAFLPVVFLIDGSITFDKHTSGTYPSVDQGLEFASVLSDPTLVNAIEVTNLNSSEVTFQNLYFKDFAFYTGIGRTAIFCYTSRNILITNCHFINNYQSINFFSYSETSEVSYNDFLITNGTTQGAVAYNATASYVSNYHLLNVHHNNITTSGGTPASGTRGIQVTMYYPCNGEFIIENNTIEYCGMGVYVEDYVGATTDPLAIVRIGSNLFNDNAAYSMWLINPMPYWEVYSNTLDAATGQLIIMATYYPPNIHGIDLIEPLNHLGFTPVNYGNIFTANAPSSFSIQAAGAFGSGTRIVGQNVRQTVQVMYDKYTFIRDNRIRDTSIPIDLLVEANDTIDTPSPVAAAIAGSALDVAYTLPGQATSNLDLVMDFYKSNSNGDLKQYLGKDTVTSLTGGTYITSLTVPIGVTVSSGDTIAFTASGYGTYTGDIAGTSEVAYVRAKSYCCPAFAIITDDTTVCATYPFVVDIYKPNCGDSVNVNFGDGTDTTVAFNVLHVSHQYNTDSSYIISAHTVNHSGNCLARVDSITMNVRDCAPPSCVDCLASFAPIPGKKYLVSAWVREDGAAPTKTSYTYPSITVSCPSASYTSSAFVPEGNIIDGWQRIEKTFVIPLAATDLEISLGCSTGDCFFDDIRVLPFDGSLKSYVFDPVTLKLTAELDERNYATLYEYDEEGKLVRVKKETAKGIMTIKENRSVTQK